MARCSRLQGQVLADAGTIIDHGADNVTVKIDRADVRFNWDARQRALVIPFQIQSGGNQFTLRAALEMPADQNGVWLFSMARSDPVIDPIILASAGKSDEEGFALNRVAVRARIDTVRHRIDLEQGDFSRVDTRPAYNVAVAVTGSLDYSGAEPHLAFGVAGTRMPMEVMMRMWPVFTTVHVREWVESHMSGGMVERVVIAANAPLPDFKADGPPMPNEGFSVDIETSGTTLRPLDSLPAIRDADLTVRITGSYRQCQPRPRHRGGDAGTQAQYREWHFRNSGYPSQGWRRRAPASASTERFRRRPRCWPATGYAIRSASCSIQRRAAARSPLKSPSSF